MEYMVIKLFHHETRAKSRYFGYSTSGQILCHNVQGCYLGGSFVNVRLLEAKNKCLSGEGIL